MPSEDSILKEARENFDYAVREWQDIRREGQYDMRCVAGDPWDPKERKQRVDNGRPCLSLDELGQYINTVANSARQNKRAVKVTPEGNGANDKSARFRGDIIRQIEYKSNAQVAYLTALDNMLNRSYGYYRIGTRYCAPDSFDQEIYISRIANPDLVYLDPDAKELDGSDGQWAFVLEPMRVEVFKRKYPSARIQNFSTEQVALAPAWLRENSIQVAEYWRAETKKDTLILLENDTPIKLSDVPGAKIEAPDPRTDRGFVLLPDGARLQYVNRRRIEDNTICQYITNGLEILEENPWKGKWIPIVPMYGKELYVDEGGGAKRHLMSLIRLARDPYMLYCYYRTCQAELVGMTPKLPFVGAEGQFDTNTDWANINKVPAAYAEYKAITTATGQVVLPPPARPQYDPPIQSLEMGAEAARRAIMSAVGISPLPTAAQRQNEKSGVALQHIASQEALGSFHFIDNFDMALAHGGRIMDDLLSVVYDTPREIPTRNDQEEHSSVKINQASTDDNGEAQEFYTDRGNHGVTISTGPSYESQREAATDFATKLSQNESIFPRIADLVVKLMNLGPLGDAIAKRLEPPGVDSGIPPQVQQQIQALTQQHDQLVQELQAAMTKLKERTEEKALELQSKERVAAMQAQVELSIAELQAGVAKAVKLAEMDIQRLEHMHEAGMVEKEAELAPEPEPAGAK